MRKPKYILVILILTFLSQKVEALDIEYGSILGVKSNNILIEYSNIENKNNFLCNILTLNCNPTKKETLGKTPERIIKKSIKKELDTKKAHHVTFSPSGNLLAYIISPTENNKKRAYIIKNIKTKKEYIISENVSYWDLVDDQGKVFEFSPNNNNLIYLDDFEGFMSLYKVDITKIGNKNINSIKLTTSAYQIDDFLFYNSQTLFYIGNTKENPYYWSLYKYDIKSGTDKIIESYVSYSSKLRKIGDSIIFGHLQAKGYGPEIYNVNKRKLQSFNIPNVDTKKSVMNQEVVKAGNSYGVLMTPNGRDITKSYPLVIWLHGGPYRQTSYGYHPFHSYGIYDSILELLRKNNVIVLKLDYRGSLGFGRIYAESIEKSVGLGDVQDVMDAVNYTRNRYTISNVYLAGNSYGGYLSLKSLVEHPNTFTGVFSINGVTDWESLMVRMQRSIFNTQFGGLPSSTTQAFYDQASIINKIGNIGNQKIEIVQGESDRTIPLWQSVLLKEKLQQQNKNLIYVTYPKEDHVFKEKKNISDLCTQLFNFVGVPIDPECNN